jgi:chloramphenicol 3-O phosphotransferase
VASTIIVLNGTSSSGKTSILKSLQDQLPDPFLDMGIDRFIFMLPGRYLNRPLWDEVLGKAIQSGAAGKTLVSGMHYAIAAAAQRGNHVIADHVLVEKSWVDECARLFAGMNAYLIGVRCPLEVLEQRERSRQDRTLGQARIQYDVVHRHTQYDLEVDTSLFSAEQCARKIIERLKTPPEAFRQLLALAALSSANGSP